MGVPPRAFGAESTAAKFFAKKHGGHEGLGYNERDGWTCNGVMFGENGYLDREYGESEVTDSDFNAVIATLIDASNSPERFPIVDHVIEACRESHNYTVEFIRGQLDKF